jgi:hypothetical protein
VAHIKCRKSRTEIYTNVCSRKKSGGFKKSLLLLKIRRISKILAFAKNQADLQNPCVYGKTGGFTKSLRLQKNRRIYKIIAPTEKQADDRILAGVEIPAPGKKPAGLEKLAARLLFRLGGISSC